MNLDLASVLGTLLGALGVIGGQLLEGGHLSQILQLTSAIIVLGGTLGAMFLAYPMVDIRRAFSMIPSIYKTDDQDLRPLIQEIVQVASIARKDGLLAVETMRGSIQDPLFRRTIKFLIDGFEVNAVREIIDAEIELAYESDENAAKVFEGAGGYAPTIGILGAVLGLIHVMTMLNEPNKIGEGIAVAFVATIYGVGLANLILLPWGSKLKRKAQMRMLSREVVKRGIIGIQDGINPNFLQERLEIYAHQTERQGKK